MGNSFGYDAGSNEVQLVGAIDGFGAVGGAEFWEKEFEITFDRLAGDSEGAADFLVRQAAGKVLEQFQFTRG